MCVPSAEGRRLIMLLLEQDRNKPYNSVYLPTTNQSWREIIWRLRNEIFTHQLRCLNCVLDHCSFSVLGVCWCPDVCICLSWPSFTGWRGDFGWTHTDVECGDGCEELTGWALCPGGQRWWETCMYLSHFLLDWSEPLVWQSISPFSLTASSRPWCWWLCSTALLGYLAEGFM